MLECVGIRSSSSAPLRPGPHLAGVGGPGREQDNNDRAHVRRTVLRSQLNTPSVIRLK